MGWLSDRQIKARCIKPAHFLDVGNGKWVPVIPGVTHSAEQVENWVIRSYSRLLTVKNDEHLVKLGWSPMIEPFFAEAVSRDESGAPVPSFGLSSYGYDIRMAAEDIKIFSNINSTIIDPLNMTSDCYVPAEIRVDEQGRKYYVQPPTSLSLGHTPEVFDVSRDLLITCLGKSTYARAGISVVVTPLEPEWKGQLVVEVVNHTTSPCKIYLESGIGQLLFGKGEEECEVSYKDRQGKYQDQVGTQDSLAARKAS